MIQFIWGKLPASYKACPEALYNQHSHRVLQSSKGWESFYIVRGKKAIASLHVYCQGNAARSPYRAPYGGMDIAHKLEKKVFILFLSFVLQALHRIGVKHLSIRQRSNVVKKQDRFHRIFLRAGFVLEKAEDASILSVSKKFRTNLHESAQKRLRKCERNNFVFQHMADRQLKTVYDFISACRKKKEYSLSMSWLQVKKLSTTFPKKVICFAVFDGDEMAAASLCILEDEHTLYDFYHDHAEKFDPFSPVVFLINGMNDWCRRHHIKQIDLGTSMQGKSINKGLSQFKQRLGATRATRKTFAIDLA